MIYLPFREADYEPKHSETFGYSLLSRRKALFASFSCTIFFALFSFSLIHERPWIRSDPRADSQKVGAIVISPIFALPYANVQS